VDGHLLTDTVAGMPVWAGIAVAFLGLLVAGGVVVRRMVAALRRRFAAHRRAPWWRFPHRR